MNLTAVPSLSNIYKDNTNEPATIYNLKHLWYLDTMETYIKHCISGY